jgi:hypothetical protein
VKISGQEIHSRHRNIEDGDAVALGLKVDEFDERFSRDSFRESRIVLDAAGVPKQSSGLALFEDDGVDSGTPKLDCGGEPGRAGADNADVSCGHVCPPNAASISSINTGSWNPGKGSRASRLRRRRIASLSVHVIQPVIKSWRARGDSYAPIFARIYLIFTSLS